MHCNDVLLVLLTALTTDLKTFLIVCYFLFGFRNIIDELCLQKVVPKVHPIVDLLVGLHNQQGCHWAGDVQETAK